MKKLLLILGITNFIAIETSLIISCSNKLTKPIEQEQATNPNQCGNSCELEFSEILKSYFSIASTGNYLRIESVRKQLPSDVVSTGGPFVAYLVNDDIISNVRNFYKENGIQSDEYKGDTYIDKIVNVKIIFSKIKSLYYVTLFSAEMPPLPEKDNEQPNPRANHFKI